MNDIQLITKNYEDSKEFSLKIIKIEPSVDYGEHYYDVLYRSEEGQFNDTVFVQDNMVLILPR